jgi:hypothetical protein
VTVLPAGLVPVRDVTTREVLYGARSTAYRYELLEHNTTTGVDSLVGFLDGVRDGGSMQWSSSASVKKSCTLSVVDLVKAGPGLTRVSDVNLISTRIRPVLVIEGLPEIPLGVYVVTAAPEQWDATGRTYSIELHDKSTVLEQDAVEVTYSVGTSTAVLGLVKAVVESAGELIDVDASDTRTLTSPLVWEAGTSKLRIVNDLLDALNYNALFVDGVGNFQATKYVAPADRSVRYSMLNDDSGARMVRELSDGQESIYLPEWKRDRDTYKVPNRVIAVAAGGGDAEPLSGTVTNEDSTSPFSFPSRGRWVTRVLDGVDVPDLSEAATVTFLEDKARQTLIAASAVQAAVTVTCLPIPIELLDALVFASTPAGINARHVVRGVSLGLSFAGVMELELQEVIS